jgi:hypothetical protein
MSRRKPQKIALDLENNVAYVPVGLYAKDGYVTIDLDDVGLASQYYWTPDSNGYAKTSGGQPYGKYVYMHRMINKTPPHLVTDHINRDIRDNRRCNLRSATISQNMMNKKTYSLKTTKRTSKYKGVSFVKNPNNRKNPWLYALYNANLPKGCIRGYVSNEREAALEYNKLAKKYHGNRAVLNVVD